MSITEIPFKVQGFKCAWFTWDILCLRASSSVLICTAHFWEQITGFVAKFTDGL